MDMTYDIQWRKKMLEAPAGTFDTVLLKPIEIAFATKDGT